MIDYTRIAEHNKPISPDRWRRASLWQVLLVSVIVAGGVLAYRHPEWLKREEEPVTVAVQQPSEAPADPGVVVTMTGPSSGATVTLGGNSRDWSALNGTWSSGTATTRVGAGTNVVTSARSAEAAPTKVHVKQWYVEKWRTYSLERKVSTADCSAVSGIAGVERTTCENYGIFVERGEAFSWTQIDPHVKRALGATQ